MKIGVDFGTSFSSAAVCIDGEVQPIFFGSEQQFRTAVFFPDRYVDPAQFVLTAEHEHEIDNAIRTQKNFYSEQLALYNARLYRIAQEARGTLGSAPLPLDVLAEKRKMVIKPKEHTDDEIRQSTINALRRRWVSQQRESIAQEGLDVRKANGVFGEEAIEALYNDEDGRIFQSPKSMLGFRLEPRHRDVVVGVISQVLAHIRNTASRQLGHGVTAVVLGRPVEFRGMVGSEDDQQTQDLLERAATEAGFAGVEFLREPSAAAFNYHRQSSHSHDALIIDIGGGTTDIAFAHVGGGATEPVIHKVWGKGFGGTDVDVDLSLGAAMPLFGKDHEHGLPLHAYRSAAQISDLNRQREFVKLDVARVIEPFKARLKRLKDKGTTVRLNRDIEQLKIDLSADSYTRRELDYIEPQLWVSADNSVLASSTRRFLNEFRTLLEQVRDELGGVEPVIFMTGGMSRAPYVQACVREVFGEQAEVVMGDASLGVVVGLAQFAGVQNIMVPLAVSGRSAAESEKGQQRMERQRERFRKYMDLADKIAHAYRKQGEAFDLQYDAISGIFQGTQVGAYLSLLADKVGDAYGFNEEAGWLPSGEKFTELEYFEQLVRQDRNGRRYKSLADIPSLVLEEYEGFDDDAFGAHASELREECWSAYDCMSELREIMDDEPLPESFFDALYNWPVEASEPAAMIKEGQALCENLHQRWVSCQKAGLALLHMANYFGDDDYDPTLMEELME